jgi:hypothetical protein
VVMVSRDGAASSPVVGRISNSPHSPAWPGIRQVTGSSTCGLVRRLTFAWLPAHGRETRRHCPLWTEALVGIFLSTQELPTASSLTVQLAAHKAPVDRPWWSACSMLERKEDGPPLSWRYGSDPFHSASSLSGGSKSASASGFLLGIGWGGGEGLVWWPPPTSE